MFICFHNFFDDFTFSTNNPFLKDFSSIVAKDNKVDDELIEFELPVEGLSFGCRRRFDTFDETRPENLEDRIAAYTLLAAAQVPLSGRITIS